jgi:uncharacterized repeat protein (TIGR03803 family)
LDGKGNVYGVTIAGGTGQQCSDNGCGTVFELIHQPNGLWRERVLHSFVGDSDGALPDGALILDAAGNIYGTVVGDRSTDAHGVFELRHNPSGWSNTILYSNGAGPGLLMDKSGNLFGTIGPGDYFDAGAIGELFPGFDRWNYTQLYSFCNQNSCPDGVGVLAPPIWDGKGNLFGITEGGGIGQPACHVSLGCGVAFKMTPNGDGTWSYHVLHRFASYPTDGQIPDGGLARDPAGNLYGVTVYGGKYNTGRVFKLSLSGGRWKETSLYDFPDCASGCLPAGTLVFDRSGNLYGTSSGGLADCEGYTCGVVFKLTPEKSGKWKYTVVYKLHGTDGAFLPYGVILDGKGHIFGSTSAGGKYNFGVAFEIMP